MPNGRNDSKPSVLGISYVAYQPHLVITHPGWLGLCVTLRIPEYVCAPGRRCRSPGDVRWEVVVPDRHLRYSWRAGKEEKARVGVDFWGEACSGEQEVAFQVTMRNLAKEPRSDGVALFCLQAGGAVMFHDVEGERTFMRCADGWHTVMELIHGQWAEHRMCGFGVERGSTEPGIVTARLMVKEATAEGMALGIALDQCERLTCNHQPWPSCIHANPTWHSLGSGEEQTVHGKIYFLFGTKDDVLERYRRDFE